MTIKIFVGCLAEGTTNNDLLPLFRKFGTVVECDVLNSYGFVHMENASEARDAINALDGYVLQGSSIHVELSTASTQGRKKKFEYRDLGRTGGHQFNTRHEPYPHFIRNEPTSPRSRLPPIQPASMPPLPQQTREEYASEQVKDLLELYFRDPYAFDQYAKTYYYGERYERIMSSSRTRIEGGEPYTSSNRRDENYGYYDSRLDQGYSRRPGRDRP